MMKGAILLSLVAICGLLELSEGTSCTAVTDKTCEKTLFATGSCSSDKCACASGYVAGPYGCQVQQKAEIITTPLYFNGQGVKDEALTLKCTPGDGTDYDWFKGATQDATTTQAFTLTTLAASMDGSYTCKSSIAGILSTASDAVTLTVLDTVTTLPVVTGMPTKAIAGMMFDLTCTNVPAADGAYVWKKNNVEEGGEVSQTYTYTYAANENIVCTAGGQDSTAVTSPATADTEPTGVDLVASATSLIKGETLVISCDLTDGFPVGEATIITYTVEKDGTDITSSGTKNKNKLLLANVDTSDSGSYVCKTDVGSKESSAVAITIDTSMEKDEIKVSSTEVLKDGYFTLTCSYKAPDLSTSVTYTWEDSSGLLAGVTDKVLQFNAPGTAADELYQCTVTSAQGSVKNDPKAISADAIAVFAATTPTISDNLAVGLDYGIGTTYTLTCNSDYDSPGVTYEWTVGTTTQSETSKTFSYKATDTSTDVKCKAKFSTSTTQEATKPILGLRITSIGITVSGAVVTAPTPVHGSILKFSCVVTKGSGVSDSISYQWVKDSVDVVTTQEYEYTVASSGTTAVQITCKATVGTQTVTASALRVTPAAANVAPVVTGSSTTPFVGADVVLVCTSDAHAEDVTYKWKKGGTVISGATSYTYKIDDIEASDDGAYTCSTTINSVASSYSSNYNIATQSHRTCTYSSECNQPNFDDTKCVDSKCQCKSGYTLKGGVCSGTGALLGSLFLVMVAAFIQKLF